MQNESEKRLSPEAQTQIDSLCNQISLANHLDPEIQNELRTHLEDKLHAYLTGQIPLSEADALLLAKSHFGNPVTIQSLFHTVHPTARPLSLARKCATAILATLAASLLVSLFESFWRLHVLYPATLAFPPENYTALQRMPNFSVATSLSSTVHLLVVLGNAIQSLLLIASLWALLHSFRRQHTQGTRPWFEKRTPFLITGIVLAAFVINLVVSNWIRQRTWNAAPAFSAGPLVSYAYPFTNVLFGLSTLAVQALLWLSYFSPKTWRARLAAILCWLLYYLAVPIIQAFVWTTTLVVTSHVKLRDPSLTALLTSVFTLMLYNLPRLLIIAAAALTTYHFLTERRHQTQPSAA